MNRFHLLFAVLCLGGLSPLVQTVGPEVSGNKVDKIQLSRSQQLQVFGRIITLVSSTVHSLVNTKKSKSDRSKSLGQIRSALGAAKIYHNEKEICSGVHLKPWILLTTAKCVHGLEVDEMAAELTYFGAKRKQLYREKVDIHTITTDPDYNPDDPLKNLAMLFIYAKVHWDVDEFSLPNRELPPDYFIKKKIETSVIKWIYDDDAEVYVGQTQVRDLTTDYKKCGELDSVKHWYCALKPEGKDHMTPVDVGTPLFYWKGKLRRIIGFYSGWNQDKDMAGHLYQSIQQSIDWIEEYIGEHPLPPPE